MKLYKLVYAYSYGHEVEAAIGYFDDETKALAAWRGCFTVKGEGMAYGDHLDEAKREYTFSCCGWREWYRLEEFEHDNKVNSWGGHPCTLNTVDFKIQEHIKALSSAAGALRRSSLNYSNGPMPPLGS